jgi:hypothetical protein
MYSLSSMSSFFFWSIILQNFEMKFRIVLSELVQVWSSLGFFHSIFFLFIYKWTGTDNRRNAYMSLPLYNNIYMASNKGWSAGDNRCLRGSDSGSLKVTGWPTRVRDFRGRHLRSPHQRLQVMSHPTKKNKKTLNRKALEERHQNWLKFGK